MPCPICGSSKLEKKIIETQEAVRRLPLELLRCENCGVLFAEDYARDRAGIYGAAYGSWSAEDATAAEEIRRAKKTAFQAQLRHLLSFIKPAGRKLLDIGTGGGYLLEVARDMGFDCYGTEISDHWARVAGEKFPSRIFSGPLAAAKFSDEFFDVISMTDVLEHLPDPQATLKEISRILKQSGYLFIISPNSDSLTRKIFGRRWFQYKYEHTFYFNRCSLKKLLGQNSLELLQFKNNRKKFPLSYYHQYFKKYSFLGLGKILAAVYPLLPNAIQNFCFSNPVTGEFLAIAKKK